MNGKQTVLVDLDSIVVNIEEEWYRRYNEKHGDDLSIERVLSWDTSKYAKAGAAVFDTLNEPGFFEALKPLPGAVEGVNELLDEARVLIVSHGPTPGSYSEKARWLQRWLPEVSLKQLILTYSKDAVRGDVLFDDGPHNLRSYRQAWPDSRLATIAYPYNADVRAEAGVVDLVAGDYHDTAAAWAAFVRWVKEVRS